jgi:hypothetical protein
MRVPEIFKNIVAFLCVEDNNRYAPIGTGFRIYLSEGDSVFSYVVTCRHVVQRSLDVREPIYVRLDRSDKSGVDYRPLADGWEFHADPTVDLAVLPHEPKGEPFEFAALEVDGILSDDVLQEDPEAISVGDEAFFVGLFEPYYGYEKNVPIFRFGRLAMVTDEPIGTSGVYSERYLLEAQVYPWNSGSPVFMPFVGPDGQVVFQIVGVAAGFFPDRQREWISADGPTRWMHMGISSVVPAGKIREIIYNESLSSARKNKIRAGRMEKAAESRSDDAGSTT